MTREEALASLSESPYPEDKINDDVNYVMQKLELTYEEFAKIMDSPPRGFSDYPSYYPIIQHMKAIIRPAFKLFLGWTPPMFYEMDARKNIRQEGYN